MYRVICLIFIVLIVISCSTPLSVAVEEADETLAGSLPPINPNIPAEPITLEVWLDLDFTRDNTLYDELAEEFEAVYPQVEVEIFSFVRESIPQRVKLEVESDVPPDVVQGHVYAMAGQGLAEPLEQQWAEWEATNPEAATQFLPAAMEEVI